MSDPTTSLTLPGNITRETFRRFALYDTFVRKKGWRNPALFALIFTAFAVVCFLARRTHPQAMLLGSVLLGVGLILPLVWLGMYDASVRRQAKRLGLRADKAQYLVTLTPEKIHVVKDKETADFSWDAVYLARRAKGCLYLYVSPTRAFLLPDSQKSEAAWELICAKVAPEKRQ